MGGCVQTNKPGTAVFYTTFVLLARIDNRFGAVVRARSYHDNHCVLVEWFAVLVQISVR